MHVLKTFGPPVLIYQRCAMLLPCECISLNGTMITSPINANIHADEVSLLWQMLLNEEVSLKGIM